MKSEEEKIIAEYDKFLKEIGCDGLDSLAWGSTFCQRWRSSRAFMAEVKNTVAGSNDGVSDNEADAGEMSFDAMIERMKEIGEEVEDQEPTGHERSDRGRFPVTDDGSPEGETINNHHDKDPP